MSVEQGSSDRSKSEVAKGGGVSFVTITAKNADQRVDNFLLGRLKGVPKSKIYRVIRKGEVRINKKRCKPETKLYEGDLVRIPPVYGVSERNAPVRVSDSLVEHLKKSVIYEDDQVLVVNKPSGLAVHGGSGVTLGLIEALRTMYPEHQFLELAHRLDRDTSGLILIAKSRPALKALHKQFREDVVNKTYHLAVHGKWPKHIKKVDAPLRKNDLKSGERMVVVSVDGKPSQTLFRVLGRSDFFTLVEAKPITGRTHQIRVHAAFSGCPIVGDDKYIQSLVSNYHGLQKCRLMLHARAIEFYLPQKDKTQQPKKMSLQADYDGVFSGGLERMSLKEVH